MFNIFFKRLRFVVILFFCNHRTRSFVCKKGNPPEHSIFVLVFRGISGMTPADSLPFLSAADNGVIGTGSDLIHDGIEQTEDGKAGQSNGHIQNRVIKGKQ